MKVWPEVGKANRSRRRSIWLNPKPKASPFHTKRRLPSLSAAALLLLPARTSALSVLTHEAFIDAAWQDSTQPLLAARFPNATPAELATAHGYAYAGSIVQDMGYYPFGNRFFTDLLHY